MSFQTKLLILLFFSCLSQAQPVTATVFPRGCEVIGFGYNGTDLILNDSGNQTYYLIQNRSSTALEMQRVVPSNDFMSPPLTARLEPSNWGAFASDIANVTFECLSIDKDNATKVACSDVLEVCQYPRVKFALSNMGNYWVSVNNDQRQVINDSTAKGIYLRW